MGRHPSTPLHTCSNPHANPPAQTSRSVVMLTSPALPSRSSSLPPLPPNPCLAFLPLPPVPVIVRPELTPNQAGYDPSDPELRAAAALLQEALNAQGVVQEEALWTRVIEE